ncbi:MAG: hypothetical protein IPO34_15885 [Dehalococcoidia bacterium]|nr:hypothetical protein [Dehalococcoidia bacterium]
MPVNDTSDEEQGNHAERDEQILHNDNAGLKTHLTQQQKQVGQIIAHQGSVSCFNAASVPALAMAIPTIAFAKQGVIQLHP